MEGIGKSGTETSATGSYFTPLLISMFGVIATSIAVLSYHLIMVRYCLRRRRQRALLNNNNLSQPNASNTGEIFTGLDEKILNSIPILCYSTKLLSNQFRLDQSECSICLGDLEDNDMVRLLPNCRHVFHISCIDKWFLAHTNCPVCRSDIGSVEIYNSQGISGEDQNQNNQERFGLNNDRDQESSVHINIEKVRYSNGLLRHCVSLVLPTEEKQEFSVTGLKRSLSSDNYSLVVINAKTELNINKPSSSYFGCSRKVFIEDKSYSGTVYGRQLHQMSSMLLSSISQLKTCRNLNVDNDIVRCPV